MAIASCALAASSSESWPGSGEKKIPPETPTPPPTQIHTISGETSTWKLAGGACVA